MNQQFVIDTLPPSAVRYAIERMPDSEGLQLLRFARSRCIDLPFEAEDLLQEAYVRVLEGKRKWPAHVAAVPFFINVIRSLAHDHHQRRNAVGLRPLNDSHTQIAVNDISDDPAWFKTRLAMLKKAIGTDKALKALADGMMNDMRGDALERHLGVNATELATLRKRLRRRILAQSFRGDA